VPFDTVAGHIREDFIPDSRPHWYWQPNPRKPREKYTTTRKALTRGCTNHCYL